MTSASYGEVSPKPWGRDAGTKLRAYEVIATLGEGGMGEVYRARDTRLDREVAIKLEGADADSRTDIFALGALLYEMATRRRAFEGKNRTSLIAAIVSSQPPAISTVQPMGSPALDHVVQKCLEKEPDDRWQSARDVMAELQWIADPDWRGTRRQHGWPRVVLPD